MADYKDHFSGHSDTYAQARPDYPASLFEFLSGLCKEHDLAWDCACGNGQASLSLTDYFEKVIATDASAQQLAQAPSHEKIQYHQINAEERFLAPGSVDLVAVAQALHWFDLPRFYENVRTVLKDDGLIAVWSYGLHQIEESVDQVIEHFYEDIVGTYWPMERRHVEAAYSDLDFPFEELPAPSMTMDKMWTLDDLLNYLESWSAVQRFKKDRGTDPLEQIRSQLESCWGSTDKRKVSWPLTLRIGKN